MTTENRMYLGDERGHEGRQVEVTESALGTHVHICGRSGSGKSRLIMRMIETDIYNNEFNDGGGFIIIEPAGPVYDHGFACASMYPGARKRLHVIDLSQRKFYPGITILTSPRAWI